MTAIQIDISALISSCQIDLLQAKPCPISYIDKVALKNNKLPELLGTSPINVYALWKRGTPSSDWQLMYIGQRSSKYGWSRVEQHLFSTPKGTQSKLKEVQAAIASGAEIGVTAILVEPDSIRLAVEEELIARNSPTEEHAQWNLKARAKAKRTRATRPQ